MYWLSPAKRKGIKKTLDNDTEPPILRKLILQYNIFEVSVQILSEGRPRMFVVGKGVSCALSKNRLLSGMLYHIE